MNIIGWIYRKNYGIAVNSSNKKLVAGVDEAGYGPNLGPLVVGASLWSVPCWMGEEDLRDAFLGGFECAAWYDQCPHIPLGDSKQLYRPGGGLQSLESGLAAMLATVSTAQQQSCEASLPVWLGSLEDLLQQLANPARLEPSLPWYRELERLPIPCSVEPAEILRMKAMAECSFDSTGIRLVATRAAIVAEPEFNRKLDRLGSKGSVLTTTSLELVANLLKDRRDPVEVFCDRHGGRKDYLPCLMDCWPEKWFREIAREPHRSSYHDCESNNACGAVPMTIHFSIGGDAFPPTALASMLAKYLRERLMQAFNQFWSAQLPDLRATAGYPVDAKRFVRDLGDKPSQLGLAKELWWRRR